MEADNFPTPAPKPSTLPRLSKLPQPRSILQQEGSSASFVRPETSIGIRDTIPRARRTSVHINNGNSTAVPSSNSQPSDTKQDCPPAVPGRTNQRSQTLRQPLRPPVRLQSQRDRHGGKRNDLDGLFQSEMVAEQSRQQENNVHELDRSSGSDSTSPKASPTASASSEKLDIPITRKSRPSLSDRTIESLAQVPPSPANNRRRSGFFAPTSPMTPKRPTSNAGRTPSVSNLDLGSVRRSNIARPLSPTKTTSTGQNDTAAARRTGTFLPRSPQKSSASSIDLGRPRSPVKTAPRISTNPTKAKPNNGLPTNTVRRVTMPMKSQRSATEGNATAAEDASKSQKSPQTSSAFLRQQIAKAKAEHRASTKMQTDNTVNPSSKAYDFENCEDPFNQKRNGEMQPLLKRIDNARRDGKLHIAAMSLKTVPAEVMQMYDPPAMEDSSVTWDETVDLVRLNGADNEIEEIGENVFPDVSLEELQNTTDQEAKGSQFGGLEYLDFHGNKLHSIPLGLRRLSRLTNLNLSRNNLDNWALDVIKQVSTLKDLNLAHNNLSNELPSSVCSLANLEALDVSCNKLTAVSPSIRDLTGLRSLSVSSNRLTNLSFDCLAQLPYLINISAASNALTGALFPSSVTKLTNLQTLDVADNAIASLTFSRNLQLPSILRLDVCNNRLGAVPNMSTWTSLVAFLAEGNCLRDLPPGLTDLRHSLKTVNLERNDLRSLEPEEGLAKMQGLESLLLAGNPLRERRLLNMGTQEIKREMERKVELAEKVKGG